jgi:hypothetical protein
MSVRIMGWDYICNCLLDEWEFSIMLASRMQWDLFP